MKKRLLALLLALSLAGSMMPVAALADEPAGSSPAQSVPVNEPLEADTQEEAAPPEATPSATPEENALAGTQAPTGSVEQTEPTAAPGTEATSEPSAAPESETAELTATSEPSATPEDETVPEQDALQTLALDAPQLLSEPQPASEPAAIRVYYREKGGVNFLNPIVPLTGKYMWVSLAGSGVTGDTLAEYKFELKGPGEETTPIEDVAIGDEAGNYAIWQGQTFEKPGTYTVNIKQGDDIVATGNIKIVKFIFETGDGGTFADEVKPNEHIGFYQEAGLFSSYLLLHGDVPKVTTTGNDLMGWASVLGVTSADDEKLLEKDKNGVKRNYDIYSIIQKLGPRGDDTYTVYAAYGERIVYSFGLYNGESKVDPYGRVEMGEISGEYTPDEHKKELTLKNTGNRPLTLNRRYEVDFLDIQYKNAAGEGSNAGTTLQPGEENNGTLVLTPKANLKPGTYTGTIGFFVDEQGALYQYTVTFSVLSATLVVTPPAKEKSYGATMTAADIPDEEIKIVYENTKVEYPKTLKDLGVTLDSSGFRGDAQVKSGAYAYTLTPSQNTAFTVKLADGAPGVTVTQATPVEEMIEAGGISVGSKIEKSTLKGTFVNPNDRTKGVTGELTWATNEEFSSEVAGTYPATWTFTPDDEQNYTSATGTVEVTVSEKTATQLNRDEASATVVTYDARQHSLAYTSDRKEENTPITVQYCLQGTEEWSTVAPTNAGTYNVKATIGESDNYASASINDTLTINPKAITGITANVANKVYDGTTAVDVSYFSLDGVERGDEVTAAYTAQFESAAASSKQIRVNFTLDKQLQGRSAANYTLPDMADFHKYATIYPRPLTVEAKSITKGYGTLLALTADNFTVSGLLEGEDPGLQFICKGEAPDANVAGSPYAITATLSNTNYTFKSMSFQYEKSDCGSITVTKAKPQVNGELSVGAGRKNCKLEDVALGGGFVNPNNPGMPVTGTLKWKAPDTTLPDADTYTATWVFTPQDTANYESPVEGTALVDLGDKEPVHITVEGPTEITYTGSKYGDGHGLKVALDPEGSTYTVEYRPANTAEEWTQEPPTNAGTYEMRIDAYPPPAVHVPGQLEYIQNQVTIQFTILPATPASTAPKELTVPEGTALTSETVQNAFENAFTFNEKSVEGVLSWMVPGGVITDDGMEFVWVFTPTDNNGNLTTVSGKTTFKLAPDNRKIIAEVYNLPASLSYQDYAVVDTEKSGLKAGDIVTFFKDAACTDPISGAVTVTAADVTAKSLLVSLDPDALEPEAAGTVYARITSSKMHQANGFDYQAEPGFRLEDDGGGPVESIIVHRGEPEINTKVIAKLFDEATAVERVTFALNGADIAELLPEAEPNAKERELKGLKLGSGATLTVTVVFPHPDKVRHADDKITMTVTAAVACAGTLDMDAEAETTGNDPPAVKLDPEKACDALESEQDRKDLAEGKKIDYLLTVDGKGKEGKDIPQEDKTEVKETLEKRSADYEVAQYLDIDLTRTINNGSAEKIDETPNPLTITIHITDTVKTEATRDTKWPQYVIVRVHNGVATILEDLDTDPDTITISTRLFSTYAIAYRNPRGDLVVSKTVTGTAGDHSKRFTFNITLGDVSITTTGVVSYGDIAFNAGKATITLKHGESLKATGLPVGMPYTVTEVEADQDGYTTTATAASGTIAEGTTTAAFTNHKDAPAQGVYTGNVPMTGDENAPALWLAMLVISALGLAAVSRYLHRRKRNG